MEEVKEPKSLFYARVLRQNWTGKAGQNEEAALELERLYEESGYLRRKSDELREVAKDLLESVNSAIKTGDWKVDGVCDPELVIQRARKALKEKDD